ARARSAVRHSLGPVRGEAIGNFPPPAGLASSAAAFAALSLAARAAPGLPGDERGRSVPAPPGRGSPRRGMWGGGLRCWARRRGLRLAAREKARWRGQFRRADLSRSALAQVAASRGGPRRGGKGGELPRGNAAQR